ncbi:MAG: aldo/keto reductase [Deltaproteobacteria bacterium]|nr:aldo/keto reductase [Deltaproteobacteria bacterium]
MPTEPEMPTRRLGRSSLMVPRLGLGTYFFGPGRADLTPRQAARLLHEALAHGVTFWDTSDDYETQPHVAEGLRGAPRERILVCTKTYAGTALGARRAVTRALRELRTDCVDVFLLHYVQSLDELEAKHGALKGLQEMKRRGWVRAVGLSTHRPDVLARAARFPEVEVVMAPLNAAGHYIEGGGAEAMFQGAAACHCAGKGVVAIKVLGGGEIARAHRPAALVRALRLRIADCICVGVADRPELAANLSVLHRTRKPT